MINKKIVKAAESCLKGKTVTDLCIGISLIACELSDGNIGISYVLRDHLDSECCAFGYALDVVGMNAKDVAEWAVTGEDDIQRSIGICVLNAASRCLDIPDDTRSKTPYGLDTDEFYTVGMIGYIAPVAASFAETAKEIIIFDEGVELHGGKGRVEPGEKQKELLPNCNIVVMSGTTTINHTIDELLDICKNARDIVIVGPSTPMFPEAFAGTPVSRLAGSWWKTEYKKDIFRMVSRGCGVGHLRQYMLKKCAAVE